MKHAYITILCITIVSLLSGCEKDVSFLIRDPEGTETITLSNDQNVFVRLGDYYLYMDEDNNLISKNGIVAFYCYDQTEYLSAIDTLYSSHWYKQMAVLPRYGYAVRLGEQGQDGYARLLALEYTEDEKGVSGAVFKYQYPWHPSNEQTVIFTQEDPPSPHDPWDWDDPEPTEPIEPIDPTKPSGEVDYDTFWQGTTWHFKGTMTCDGDGEQEFTITFIDLQHKIYSSDLETKYWLATSLKWEDYRGWRITLRGYDDGGHTSFDFDYSNPNAVRCEYHHWDAQNDFCKAVFSGTKVK